MGVRSHDVFASREQLIQCLWHHFEIQSHGTALRFDQAVYDQAWKIFHDKQVQFNNITNIEALNLKKFLKYSFPG